MDREQILYTGIYCGGLYALWRVILTVFYPFVSGSLWQNLIGPAIVKRWPTAGQSEDKSRPSYLPGDDGEPLVVAFGLFPAPIDYVTHGIRDGLLLGLLCALLPELYLPGLMTFVLAIVIIKHVLRIYAAHGSVVTDRLIWGGREILMYVGAVLALQSTHFIR
ncbi:hypothetical protein [Paraburkholderia sp. SIMBA_054]|uniref:hypothetical protein n=1 Tax=Paraburkholderia sp. SIMBA_054 TaxID=3085795 RepID=UPI0039798EAB